MDEGRPPSVMILGCGRSGTSIFGELFEHLPGYTYTSEPPFTDVINTDFTLPQAFKVPHESDGYVGRPGLSFPLDALFRAQPQMRIFWIVRHPLDAICSLRVGIAQNWGHHPRPPDWKEWTIRPLLERCAHHWSFINSAGYEQVASIATLVRFEDMIRAPADFAQNVLQSLQLDPVQYEQAVGEWAKRVQNTNNAEFIEAETSRHYSRPDHSVRVGRWQENLTEDNVTSLLPIVRETAVSFGYDTRESAS